MIVLVVLRRNSCFYKKDELVLGQSVKKAVTNMGLELIF